MRNRRAGCVQARELFVGQVHAVAEDCARTPYMTGHCMEVCRGRTDVVLRGDL